jgi:hypothetical protein
MVCCRRRSRGEPYLRSCTAPSPTPHLSPSMGAPPRRKELQRGGSGSGDPTPYSSSMPYLERCTTSPFPQRRRLPPTMNCKEEENRGVADLAAEICQPTLKGQRGILYTYTRPRTTIGTIPSLLLHGLAGERSSGPARKARERDQRRRGRERLRETGRGALFECIIVSLL